MTKTRFRLAALVVVAFALVASACLQIRLIALVGDKALSPGEVATFKIDLYRQSDINDATGYVFLLMGTQDLDFSGTTNFDLKANFGGPFLPVADAALEAFLLASDRCSASGVSATDVDAANFDDWLVARTGVEIDSSIGGFSQKFRQKAYFAREAGTDNDASGTVVFFAGMWTDDGDGIAEDGEVWCTSVFMTSIPFTP